MGGPRPTRPCWLPWHCKPRGVGTGAAVANPRGVRKLRGTTSPGRLGSRGQLHQAAIRDPKPISGPRAPPRAPRRARTLRRAWPRGHQQARAPPACTHSGARTPTARPTSATPRPPPRPAPALAAQATAFPLAARRVTRGARPRPSSVTRRRRRWRGLVSSGDWQRRRRPELEPQRLREGGRGGGRGVGPRRLPGRRFSFERRRFQLWGGGGTAHP